MEGLDMRGREEVVMKRKNDCCDDKRIREGGGEGRGRREGGGRGRGGGGAGGGGRNERNL